MERRPLGAIVPNSVRAPTPEGRQQTRRRGLRHLYLAKGAKVMLTKNLYQQVGLVNGIRDQVVALVFADDAHQLQYNKRHIGSIPPVVPLTITRTNGPRTHTSDDSYIYQLSLVLATAKTS